MMMQSLKFPLPLMFSFVWSHSSVTKKLTHRYDTRALWAERTIAKLHAGILLEEMSIITEWISHFATSVGTDINNFHFVLSGNHVWKWATALRRNRNIHALLLQLSIKKVPDSRVTQVMCHVTMNKAPLITQVRACFSSNYYARDFTDLRHSSSTSDAGSMPHLPSILPAVDHSIWIFSSLLPRAIHCAVYRSIAYRGQPSYQVCDPPCNQSLSIKRFFQSDFAFLPVTCMNRTNRSAIAFSPACEQALLS